MCPPILIFWSVPSGVLGTAGAQYMLIKLNFVNREPRAHVREWVGSGTCLWGSWKEAPLPTSLGVG